MLSLIGWDHIQNDPCWYVLKQTKPELLHSQFIQKIHMCLYTAIMYKHENKTDSKS